MFEYIKGTLTFSSPAKAVVEVGGLGFCVYISLRTFEKLPPCNQDCQLFTSVIYREDSQKIYGFLEPQERDLFLSLTDISGIGPRLSLSLLGHLSPDDLFQCAEQGQAKVLSQVPGIGKKVAERLILELRDKIKKMGDMSFSLPPQQGPSLPNDATSALINLGYNGLEAQKAVKEILNSTAKELTLSEIITLALKIKK